MSTETEMPIDEKHNNLTSFHKIKTREEDLNYVHL